MHEQEIILTQLDFLRLNSLINVEEKSSHEWEELQYEIERAKITDFPEVPPDLITMNSRFTYLNVTDDKICEMTLVYPHLANTKEHKISVLAPLGTALLGLREGEEIDWEFPDGNVRKLRILEVLYQPEANGDLSF